MSLPGPNPAQPAEIASLSFETALAELEAIVARLESGKVDLEGAIDLYTRGTALKAHCEARLKSAQMRIEKIVVSPDGPTAEPFAEQ